MATTKASPLKLPIAPDQYDRRDQDHTRRLIELAFAQFGLSIQQVSSLVSVSVPNDLRNATSPIHGMHSVTAQAALSPMVRLRNPANSGVYVVVYEIAVSTKGTVASRGRIRMTADPTSATGNGALTTVWLERRDERNLVAIKSQLEGLDGVTAGNTFAESAAFWYDGLPTDTTSDYQYAHLIDPDGVPLVIVPGEALEFMDADTGTGIQTRLRVVFDEFTPAQIDLLLGSNNATYPRPTQCYGTVRTAGSVNGVAFTQLLNPANSGKYYLIRRLRATGNQVTGYYRVRRTASPINPAGAGSTITTGSVFAKDRRGGYAVTAQLVGSTFAGVATGFGDAASFFWRDRPTTDFVQTVVIGKGSIARQMPSVYPILLKPGSAIELQGTDTGAGTSIAAHYEWDEVNIADLGF